MKKYALLIMICVFALSSTSCRRVIEKIKEIKGPKAEYYDEAYEIDDVIDPNDEDAYEEYAQAAREAEAAEKEAARQEREAQRAAAQEKAAQERAAKEAARQERVAQEKAAKERAAQEKAAAKERAAQEKAAAKERAAEEKAAKEQAARAQMVTSSAEINKLLNEMEYNIKSLRILYNDAYENRRAIADTKSRMSQIIDKLSRSSDYLSKDQKKRLKNLTSEYKKFK